MWRNGYLLGNHIVILPESFHNLLHIVVIMVSLLKNIKIFSYVVLY